MNKPKIQQGFTLVELIIAVAIIAVLAAIAIPAYKGYITTSRQKAAESVLEQFPVLLESLRAENGKFPGADGVTYLYKENDDGTDNSGANTIISILPDFSPRSSTYPTTKGILFDYSLKILNPGTATEKAEFKATGVREANGIIAPNPPPGTYE